MLKLSSAAGTILSFALVLAGCGSDQFDRDGRDATLSVLTPRAPAPAEVVRSSKVAFSGRSSAASGGRVTVTAIDGQNRTHTCTTTIRSDQTWSCTQQLGDGGYTWTAQIATPGFSSAGIDFAVRTHGLAAPTIDQTPSPTRVSSPILTGTSSVVSEDEDDDEDDIVSLSVIENGKVICTIRSVTYDQWACPLSTKLPEGSHLLTAVIKKEGSTSATSNPDLFVVKTSIGAPTMDQVPTPSNVSQPVLSGHGEPGAVLSVTDAGTLLCAATVSAGGSWTCTPATLTDGTHTASATQQDDAGNVSGAVTVTFVIDTRPVGAPTLNALKSPTAEPRVTFSGTGEQGDQVSVVDTFLHTHCSGRVDNTARWSCSPADPLDDGDYVLTAFQANSVGTKSGPSAPQLLSVRTLNAPLFNAPRSPTREPTPLLTGTLDGAAARSALSVIVLDGERQVCSGAVDATGGWGCHPHGEELPEEQGGPRFGPHKSRLHQILSPSPIMGFLPDSLAIDCQVRTGGILHPGRRRRRPSSTSPPRRRASTCRC